MQHHTHIPPGYENIKRGKNRIVATREVERIILDWPAEARKRWHAIAIPQENGCIHPRNSPRSDGYVQVMIFGGSIKAHRLAYLAFKGAIFEADIDHLCRNPTCFNPDHLQQVSHYENLARGNTNVRPYSQRIECSEGHEFTPANSWISPRGKRFCVACNPQLQTKAAGITS